MSTLKLKNLQVGNSLTESDNVTLYQPATPDGSLRIASGNAGTSSDLVILGSSSSVFKNSVEMSYSNSGIGGAVFGVGTSGRFFIAPILTTGSADFTKEITYDQSVSQWNIEGSPRANGNTIWHAGNDGSGSGLDADKLDNIESGSFVRSDTADSISGVLTFNAIPAFNGGTSGSSSPFTVDSTTLVTNLNADYLDGLNSGSFVRSDTADSISGVLTFNAIPAFNGGTSGASAPFTVDSNTLVTNLNADRLDGNEASAFSLTTHNHTLDSLSNVTITSNSSGEILKWSGSAWINNTLSEAGIASSSHTHDQFTDLTINNTINVLGAVDLGDNDILRFGAGDDWEFFHDGSNNYIDLNNGNLIIRDGTTSIITFNKDSGSIVANNYVVNVASEASNTIDLNFSSSSGFTSRTATGDITLTSSNYTAGSTVTLRIIPGGSSRSITYSTGASDWVFVGTKPDVVNSGKTGIFTVTSFGTTSADCVAAYSEQE